MTEIFEYPLNVPPHLSKDVLSKLEEEKSPSLCSGLSYVCRVKKTKGFKQAKLKPGKNASHSCLKNRGRYD